MSDETPKPASFVHISGTPKSKQQKQSQYARIQSHLARFGHLKRRQKAKKDSHQDLRTQPASTTSLTQLRPSASLHSTRPELWHFFKKSPNPDFVESDTEDEEQALEILHYRDIERYGYLQLVREAYWRSRLQQFADVAFIRRANSDPFYSYARTDPLDVFTGTDYFWTVTVPSNTSLAHLFQFQNHWGACLSVSIREPMYWYCSTAILAIVRDSMANSHIKASPQVLQYIGLTYEALRERLKQPGTFSDNINITVTAYLIELSYHLRDHSTCEIHRRNLRRMVDHRGGLDALGVGGIVKNAVLDFDLYWIFEAGESLFPEARPIFQPTFVRDILHSDAQNLLGELPPGFRKLTEASTISVEVSQNIVRLANASDLDSMFRKASVDDDASLKKDLFASCPALCQIRDTTSQLGLETAISLALVLYHCRAIMKHRTVFGKFTSIRKRLMTGLRTPTSQILHDEKECWIWIWMMAVESWRTSHGVLEHEGEILLQQLHSQQGHAADDATQQHLEYIARHFLWTDALRRSFNLSWKDNERRTYLRLASASSVQHTATIDTSAQSCSGLDETAGELNVLDAVQPYSNVSQAEITVNSNMLSYVVDSFPEQMQMLSRSLSY